MNGTATAMTGVIVIGRNEGERLLRCLDSLKAPGVTVVYVDSGSTDGSAHAAAGRGAAVVELDLSIPFCAARARNAGYEHLLAAHPEVRFVQFIDGDCELKAGWLDHARAALDRSPRLGAVTGWLRERNPEGSIYNRLGDLEWNSGKVGPVDAVGGIFMIRREAFDSVGGFDPTVPAGEEPELCQRLRQKSWNLSRLDRDMASHDLAMTRFGQWWRRSVRSGYGSLDVARRFGIAKFRRNNLRVRFWTAWLTVLPALVAGSLLSALPAWPAIVVGALWPAQWLRIALRTWRSGQTMPTALAYAFFVMIAFLPQVVGQFTYGLDRLNDRGFRLIEYKHPPAASREHLS